MKIKVPCPFCLQRLGRVSCTCEDCCGSGSVEIEVPERRSTPNETSTRAGGCLPRYVRDLESSARTAVEHATEPVVGPETGPTTVTTSRLDVLVSAIDRRLYLADEDARCALKQIIEAWLKRSLLTYDALTGPHHEAEWEGECVFSHLVAPRELNDHERETTYTQTLVTDWEHVVHEVERQLLGWENQS